MVLHLSGSLGLEVLAPHPRRAALHPLVPLPDPGAVRAAWPRASPSPWPATRWPPRWPRRSAGRTVAVADGDRAAYHAAACIAANHVVALLGQVERVAATAGLPLDAFLGLTRSAVDDVARLGPAAALTGPAARGDWATLARHRDALEPAERPAYNAGVAWPAGWSTPAGRGRRPSRAAARRPSSRRRRRRGPRRCPRTWRPATVAGDPGRPGRSGR